jgi:hypothetical protein
MEAIMEMDRISQQHHPQYLQPLTACLIILAMDIITLTDITMAIAMGTIT